MEDKGTGDSSLPLFFSRSELLEFANKCMEKPEARVMVTDLGVVVQNMVQGPAGLLRSARFFPSEASLKCAARANNSHSVVARPSLSLRPNPSPKL